MVMIHQRHRQTNRQTTCDRKTALCTTVQHAIKTCNREMTFRTLKIITFAAIR